MCRTNRRSNGLRSSLWPGRMWITRSARCKHYRKSDRGTPESDPGGRSAPTSRPRLAKLQAMAPGLEKSAGTAGSPSDSKRLQALAVSQTSGWEDLVNGSTNEVWMHSGALLGLTTHHEG